MTRLILGFFALLLAGCQNIAPIGAASIEKRRQINDFQARASMAVLCDMSVGSYYRVLTPEQMRVVMGVCDRSPTQ